MPRKTTGKGSNENIPVKERSMSSQREGGRRRKRDDSGYKSRKDVDKYWGIEARADFADEAKVENEVIAVKVGTFEGNAREIPFRRGGSMLAQGKMESNYYIFWRT